MQYGDSTDENLKYIRLGCNASINSFYISILLKHVLNLIPVCHVPIELSFFSRLSVPRMITI